MCKNNFPSVKNCWSRATAKKLTMQNRKGLEKIRTQRAFFKQFGNHSNNKLLTFLFEFGTLAFETRSAAPNFLRVVSTPNPKSILSTLIKFSFFFFKINFDESFDGLKFFDNFRFNNYFQQIFIIGLSAWYIFRYGSTLLVI